MPLHEYRCNTCTRSYETIESADSPKEIPCEFFTDGRRCSGQLERKISGFAIGNNSNTKSGKYRTLRVEIIEIEFRYGRKSDRTN